MALTVFPLWSQQWTNDDGEPLAGGFVYSYIAGTSTPSPLYEDSDGTTELANPIELNAAGRFATMTYMAATPSLKILITDADLVPVMSSPFDNIAANAPAEAPADPSTAPAITVQPADQAASAGDDVTVSVVATGTAPLAYQWYLGSSGDTSSPIVGATAASYTAISIGAGVYTGWVRISNAVGTADSLTVTLTIT